MAGIRLAVLGATGAVGTTVLQVLEERDLPLSELRLLASERSAGQTRSFRGEELEVHAVTPDSFEGIDVAIFSAGASRSRTYAPHATEAGALVIDNSSAFRMDPDVPLVVPEVNAHAAREHRGVIANPNCSTMQLVPVLKPLHDAAGLEQVTISTYQAVSGTGQKAIDALRRQSAAALAGEDVEAEVYPHPIAFNALPRAGAWQGDDGYTDEELKLVNESRKILGLPELAVSATCVRVPVVTGHSESVWVQTREELTPERARTLLRAAPGVVVVDDPAADAYPTALDAAGRDEVFVGRIRRDLGRQNGLALWIVSDNLRKGAATNAVQIAELALRDGLLGSRSLPA
jgi:aspartate-semialdehyde dehydrogenase